MTERHEILEMMAELKLSGMRASYDEIVTTGVKRSQGIERILASLLKAEIAAKQARSIHYQMGIAKLPPSFGNIVVRSHHGPRSWPICRWTPRRSTAR